MRFHSSISILAAVAFCVIPESPAEAQGRRGGVSRPRPMSPPPRQRSVERGVRTPIEEFETMSAEQRQKALDRLPPAQRQRLEERLQKFNQLPPERQQALKNLYNRLHELPPERQDAVRKSINKFSQMAPQRQEAIRGELRDMASMSPDERQARLSTPAFRGKFNKKEHEIVRDMLEVLPQQ